MSRRRKKRKKSRTGVFLLLICVILGTISYSRAKLNRTRAALLTRQQEVQQKLDDEKERTEQIEELATYVQTKKYVEDMAREKFGLVYKDEIIYEGSENK